MKRADVLRLFTAALPSVVLLVACLLPASSARTADTLEALRVKAEKVLTLSADFVQETSIPMFAQPVRSHGRFVFKRPHSLRWEYTDPVHEGFVLNGDAGFRWDGDSGARKPFAAGSDPMAAVVVGQMIAWISFDLESISREYAVESLPGREIRLQMTPLRDDVKGVIKAVVITFTPEGPASLVEIKEAGGGGTVIRFGKTVVNGPRDGREFE
ncbi:MAG: outer membrane lipoprotein carrier protein LolA [Desulfovibrio sp.]|jgi:outer membrane lipoprotein carrier protein|nr:outer membrane lipoprotein carrier protein LolA [Desulfovibrio sp.]